MSADRMPEPIVEVDADGDPLPPPVLAARRFATPVSGPAYRPLARLSTASMVAGLAAYGVRVMVARSDGIDSGFLMLMAGAAAIVLVSAWYILFGKTTIDGQGIRQDWMFPKVYAWHEIGRARVVRMPLTRRLAIATGRGPVRAIHGGDRALDEAFAEIARLYAAMPR